MVGIAATAVGTAATVGTATTAVKTDMGLVPSGTTGATKSVSVRSISCVGSMAGGSCFNSSYNQLALDY